MWKWICEDTILKMKPSCLIIKAAFPFQILRAIVSCSLQVYVSPLIKGYTTSLDYFDNLTYIFATSNSMLLNAYTTLVLQKKILRLQCYIYIYACSWIISLLGKEIITHQNWGQVTFWKTEPLFLQGHTYYLKEAMTLKLDHTFWPVE